MYSKRTLLTDIPGLYAVANITLDGREFYAGASENRGGKVYIVDPGSGESTELYGGSGGVMAIVDLKDENAVLFIEEFYPVFDSATAKVIKAEIERTDTGYKVVKRTNLADVPYVHRIAVLNEEDGLYLAAGKLCKHKECSDDWSTSGTIEIGKYDPVVDHVEMHQIYDGVYKHHAMFVARNAKGFDDLYFGGTEGTFRSIYEGGRWNTEQLLTVPTSDIVAMDLDSDGRMEIAIIEEFHGNKAVLFKDLGNGMERILEIPLEFGHVLWGGSFDGRPTLITGSRAGDKSLRRFAFTPDKDARSRICGEEIIDIGQAPAQIFVTENEKGMVIVAANHGVAQMVEYQHTGN